MTPMVFLHLTDAIDGDAVRIRMDQIHAMYIHTEKAEFRAFQGHGSPVVTKEEEPFTMLVYGPHGSMHGVKETIGEIESQMADVYELAGIAALA